MLFSLLVHVYVSMFTVSFKMLINSMEEKFEYTEGVIRSRKWQKDWQRNGQTLDYPKVEIRDHKSKERKHNGQN